ncbi:hypothetical protein Tco_0347230 [Tanacetum coccineum]
MISLTDRVEGLLMLQNFAREELRRLGNDEGTSNTGVVMGGLLRLTFPNSVEKMLIGYEYEADCMLLPLSGCDMVLGIRWLTTLGDINCNFKDLTMKFNHNSKRIVLKGDENRAADALSRCSNDPTLNALTITNVSSDLLKRIQDGWQKDDSLKKSIQKLLADLNTPSKFVS